MVSDYCTQIHTLNDEIKTKSNTFSPVTDVDVKNLFFKCRVKNFL